MPARLIDAHLTTTGNATVFIAVGYVQVCGQHRWIGRGGDGELVQFPGQ
ncbi:hypothetical protein [Mesorhizobium sp. L-8-3]|nr:hypothetical protein [Mesorhizobium sp. L-8-3]